ncbi:type II toxin-antitoxin system VapC family toxin [Cyanobium sp. CH-040]|uniref:type II toxin-antitoxin system VapC family toxin n=1 Tax=Cyanobium sp. CH-040 TaxID=2823708 RepID=UPI0020CCDFA7|nr:type II toxin-antitoxin system VapC family toxin [Cyanobium sp. CH-040]MCP9926374.1 PIN domain-containing protein [Cyanobium sp. CH-040]
MIVVDASAVVDALLHAGPARRLLREETLVAPHLLDVEVASVLRRLDLRRVLPGDLPVDPLAVYRRLGIRRFPHAPLLGRVWQLRPNLSAYDATYVALAEALGCALLTADRRLAAAPGPRCPIQRLPG